MSEFFMGATLITMLATGWFALNVLIPMLPRRRGKAFGLALLSFLMMVIFAVIRGSVVEDELARLRQTDTQAYLAAVRDEKGDMEYLSELRQIDPARYENEAPAIRENLAKEAAEAAKREEQMDDEPSEATKEAVWIVKGQDAVKAKLKDSSSAEFRNLRFSRSGGAPMSCGEVNSKNSFGGFTGYQRFVSGGSPDLTFLEEEVQDFDAVWAKMCGYS